MGIDEKGTGERIRELRKKSGLKVAEISSLIGLSDERAMYYWEQGKTLPSTHNLMLLSKVFGVSMDEILVTYDLERPAEAVDLEKKH